MADSLGERLRRARRAADLTQAQVAEQTGLGRSRVAEWENDASVPRLDTLQKLAALYRVGLDALTGNGDTVAHATSGSPDTSGPAPPAAPADLTGVHLPSYWRGRMESAQLAAQMVRGLSSTIEKIAVSLEDDARGIVRSGLLNGPGAPASTLMPEPDPEVYARMLDLLRAELRAEFGTTEPPNAAPPAGHRRAGGGKG
jgi:transcriptional regulator with XRE-family HTH domain